MNFCRHPERDLSRPFADENGRSYKVCFSCSRHIPSATWDRTAPGTKQKTAKLTPITGIERRELGVRND